MPENRPSPKTFRFGPYERDLLANLKTDLGSDSEAEVVRWALVALRGVLDHGLKEWNFEGPAGKRAIALSQQPGRSLMLMETEAGGFTPWHMT